MRKKKPLLITLLAVVLTLCIVLGLTFAYNTAQKSVTNRFEITYSDDENLQAMLTEPDWDGIIAYEYGEDGKLYPIYEFQPDGTPVYGYEGGDPSKPITDLSNAGTAEPPRGPSEGYGSNLAKHLLPGISLPKNPMITNTCTLDEWVAMKVTFIYASGHARAGQPMSIIDYMYVMDMIGIDYNTTDWELIENNQPSFVYYYKSALPAAAAWDAMGGQTNPLFSTIQVPGNTTNAQFEKVQEMGGFVIYLEGFAVSAEELATYADFKAWGEAGGVVFEHTPTANMPASYPANGIVPRP